MKTIYLDSSAVVKRYVLEPGSSAVGEVYGSALNGELTLSFSAWNIGEVLGVLDKYFRRGWLSEQDYRKARLQFAGRDSKATEAKVAQDSTG